MFSECYGLGWTRKTTRGVVAIIVKKKRKGEDRNPNKWPITIKENDNNEESTWIVLYELNEKQAKRKNDDSQEKIEQNNSKIVVSEENEKIENTNEGIRTLSMKERRINKK